MRFFWNCRVASARRKSPMYLLTKSVILSQKFQLIEFLALFFLRFFHLSHHLCEGGYTCDFLRALVTRQFSKKSHHHHKQKIARVAAASLITLDPDDDFRSGCRNVSQYHHSPSQDYTHPEDHNLPTYDTTPGFKPFTVSACKQALLARIIRFPRAWPGGGATIYELKSRASRFLPHCFAESLCSKTATESRP